MPELLPARLKAALRVSKPVRRAAAVIVAAPLLYVAFLAYPEPFFPHCLRHGRFTVYSTQPIDPRIDRVLDRAEALLRQGEIDDPAVRQSIFLCNSPAVFARYSPNIRWATARDYAFGNAFIANSDVASDRAWNEASLAWESVCAHRRTRTLSGTIAHETTHTLAARHRGWLRTIFARPPSWKEEGYADYVAQESPVDVEPTTADLLRGVQTACMRYFDDRMMVAYLLEGRRLTYDSMIDAPESRNAVLRATTDWLRAGHRPRGVPDAQPPSGRAPALRRGSAVPGAHAVP